MLLLVLFVPLVFGQPSEGPLAPCQRIQNGIQCIGGDLLSILTALKDYEFDFIVIVDCDNDAGNLQQMPPVNTKVLIMENCGIANVETGALDAISADLTHLSLENNEISTMPNLTRFQNMQELNVAGNLIRNIAVIDIKNLENASFRRNRISGFKRFPFPNASRLRCLDIADNNIERLPMFIYDLPDLDSLDVSKNYIQSIENVRPLEKLKRFIIDHNLLKYLPLLPFPKLEVLRASHNRIRNIETQAIAKMEHLGILDLGFNALTTVPYVYEHHRINAIFMNNNRIKYIDELSLSSNSELKLVDLGHNIIKDISSKAMQNLPRLVNLTLAANYLGQIDPQILQSWPNLKALDVKGNRNLQILGSHFQFLQKLEYLDARGTACTTETMKYLHHIKILVFDYQIDTKEEKQSFGVKSHFGSFLFEVEKPFIDYVVALSKQLLQLPQNNPPKIAESVDEVPGTVGVDDGIGANEDESTSLHTMAIGSDVATINLEPIDGTENHISLHWWQSWAPETVEPIVGEEGDEKKEEAKKEVA